MTTSTAEGTATVTLDGGSAIKERGLCWNTTGSPTTADSHIADSSVGTGVFTDVLSGLIEGPTYNVRAYATNDVGTAYSPAVSTFKICPVFKAIHTQGMNGAPVTKTVTYHSISTTIATGIAQCWLTQNLGAEQQASSATDATNASAGWYWQFNRSQGYEVADDNITRTPAANGYTNWISSANENSDWSSVNDPCVLLLGTGWRIPTNSEWTTADAAPQYWLNAADAYNSVLKLHNAGLMYNGVISARGTSGRYWSSTQDAYLGSQAICSGYCWGYYGRFLAIDNSNSSVTNVGKGYGYAFSLRCVRDGIVLSKPFVSDPVIPTAKMTTSTAEATSTVTIDGGATVSERGICYNTTGNPTISDIVIKNGNGTGLFVSNLSGLKDGPTYYVRSYAINSVGLSYSPDVVTFKICPTFKVIHKEGLNGAPVSKTVTYHTISTNISGQPRCWLTQNLGADNEAASVDDNSEASAGWYWQFNRLQGYKHDGTNYTPYTAYTPWISSANESSDWSSANDPCNRLLGTGWRIPTSTEWSTADAAPQFWSNSSDAFSSVLKLHQAGYINGGALNSRGQIGNYWSSTQYAYLGGQSVCSGYCWGYYGYYLTISGTTSGVTYVGKQYGNGYSIRCLRDTIVQSTPYVSNVDIPTSTMTQTTVTGTATVTPDGGSPILARGLCWNTTGTPSISDGIVPAGADTGHFTSTINGLYQGPTYYVRAYATNKYGTVYSPQVSSFKICPTTFTAQHVAGVNGAPVTKLVTYHSITSTISNSAKCWLTQNLGADQQATSVNDASESSAGWYWQFNRPQGYRADGSTLTPASGSGSNNESSDWLLSNDPCNLLLGSGWRIPTSTEWSVANAAPQYWQKASDAYDSILKLHNAGYIYTSALKDRGVYGRYWSSTQYAFLGGQAVCSGYCWGYYGYYMYLNSDASGVSYIGKTYQYGFSLRCIKD